MRQESYQMDHLVQYLAQALDVKPAYQCQHLLACLCPKPYTHSVPGAFYLSCFVRCDLMHLQYYLLWHSLVASVSTRLRSSMLVNSETDRQTDRQTDCNNCNFNQDQVQDDKLHKSPTPTTQDTTVMQQPQAAIIVISILSYNSMTKYNQSR